jgi:uncharacterized protein (PEP-CTERM system associated)
MVWSYQPGQRTTFSFTALWSKTVDLVTDLEARRQEYGAEMTRQIGRRTSASLAYRFRDQEGRNGGQSYTENAIIAFVTYRFR